MKMSFVSPVLSPEILTWRFEKVSEALTPLQRLLMSFSRKILCGEFQELMKFSVNFYRMSFDIC